MEQPEQPPARVVVGAAILRHGRVLAARRTAPAEAAGRWELPGGKVEPDESPARALAREVAEELGCRVEVTGWLSGRAEVRPGLELAVASARLVEGEPVPAEHDLVRWLGPDELGDVDWLEPDRPFLPQLRALLAAGPGGRAPALPARGIFFDAADAEAAAARLRADGYQADVARERYAGEDDDEDHPWAVSTDAPLAALELLVDRYDGWLDPGDPGDPADPGRAAPGHPLPGSAPVRGAVPPPELPTAPRRVKRPPVP